MPQMTSYEPGTPSWVDLSTPNLKEAEVFYGDLFGWEAHAAPGPEAGGYTFFTLGGGGGLEIAGAMPLSGDDQPSAWTTYVSVRDVDETARAAQAAGGQVLVAPVDVMGQGRMAVFADPQGAVIAAWQPMAFQGAALIDEVNTYCWSELASRDIEAAKAFYPKVFGWQPDTRAFGTSSYTEWHADGRSVAGMVQMDDQWPEDVPAHWAVYFAVTDCDAVAARTVELGGSIAWPPTDIPVGRFAVLDDPMDAHFSVIRLTESGAG
ncbi:MAG TPA: VOC family protein [Streptosporangiaceae bacterium]|nr:VOC family protein [Streptosporangiaceae bacterium]